MTREEIRCAGAPVPRCDETIAAVGTHEQRRCQHAGRLRIRGHWYCGVHLKRRMRNKAFRLEVEEAFRQEKETARPGRKEITS